MDLTLPPVDAVCLQPWPKPQAYYRQGLQLVNLFSLAVMQGNKYQPYITKKFTFNPLLLTIKEQRLKVQNKVSLISYEDLNLKVEYIIQ
mmetsp:Transcript_30220/g.41454  ORF Transcript_30220/g.41454 Transcript_30220/m.41454 type:complete len:89 (-) Transcript_30220:826-1092(-)